MVMVPAAHTECVHWHGKCTLSLDDRCPQHPNVKTHVPVILDMKSLNYTKWRIFFIVAFLGKFGMLGHDIVEDGVVEKAMRMGKSSCTLCRLHLLEEEVRAHEAKLVEERKGDFPSLGVVWTLHVEDNRQFPLDVGELRVLAI
uniref:Uncharacterized protein n=1 Tax=Oryza rufipogon TaxID=4529 RepID=A0A0E0NIF7_ORYRU